jgi:hypothetical protein
MFNDQRPSKFTTTYSGLILGDDVKSQAHQLEGLKVLCKETLDNCHNKIITWRMGLGNHY